jgi:LmbE family N-acetylglucosaminyl deacetylase
MRTLRHQSYQNTHILGVLPHPDDESYAFSGTLALAWAGGAKITLAYATRGEAGSYKNRKMGAQRLAKIRSLEMEQACKIIGAQAPVWGEFEDGHLHETDPESLSFWVLDLLNTYQPTCVVALGADGVYGHSDHLALHIAIRDAWHALAAPMPLWESVFPMSFFSPMGRRYKKGEQTKQGPDKPRHECHLCAEVMCMKIDISTAAHLKRQTIEAHNSQLLGHKAESFLGGGVVEHLLDYEWLVCHGAPSLRPKAQHILDRF